MKTAFLFPNAAAGAFAILAHLIVGALPARADILINEVHVNHPDEPGANGDTNYEYIELKSTTGGGESTNNLTLILLDTSGSNVGNIEEVWSLAGLQTGANGLLLLGNGYDSPVGGPWSGSIEAETPGADPQGLGNDNIGPNNAFSLLLVRGFTGQQDTDLDADNNGVLDATPWAAVVDSVGIGERGVNRTYALADVTQQTFNPDNISRVEGNIAANSAAAWYGGEIAGTLPNDIAFSDEIFGGFKGRATPGRRNLAGTAALAEIRINEVNVNPPPSSDGNYEYIEIVSVSGRSAITDGYHLVLIDSKGDNDAAAGEPENLRGNIREAWDLSGFSTGVNGLMLIGDKYQTELPWGNFLDAATVLREPSGFGGGEIGANDGFSLLLVSGFSGTVGADLDTNDDGTLDVRPWSRVHDSIGFDEVGTGVASYAAEFGGNLGGLTFHPDNVSRKLASLDANASAAWYGGAYGGPAGGQSPTNISFNDNVFGGFRGQATPGRANLSTEATQRPGGAILINELSVNPPDVFDPQTAKFEDGQEFIEIRSTTHGIDGLNGLHLLVIDTSAAPRIREAIDLSPLSTGPDGLLVIGDSMDDVSLHPEDFRPYFERSTHYEDPDGIDKGDFGPNNNFVFLIVGGYQEPANSVLDPGNPPWTSLKDSVGIAGLAGIPVANVGQPGFKPDHVARLPQELVPNDAAAWYGGDFIVNPDGSGRRGEVSYGGDWFGPFKGGSTPGSLNHAAAPKASPVLLNEIVVNPSGPDGNLEFIELMATGAQSLNGYYLLLFDVGGANTGTVMEAWNLDGLATGGNGLAVIGDGYPDTEPPGGPYRDTVDTASAFIDPPGFDAEDLGGSGDIGRSNNAFCLFLVKDFTAGAGVDLDVDDVNGLDSTPWSSLVDSVGYREYDSAAGHVGVNYALADLSRTGYEPDAFARRNGSLTANAADAWYGGSLVDGSVAFDPAESFGLDPVGGLTPGKTNLPVTDPGEDPDGDGLPTLLEKALGMNPMRSDYEDYPIASGTVTVGTETFATFHYARIPGGSGTTGVDYTADGITYTVESAADLQTWQTLGNNLIVVSVTPAGNVEKVVVRHASESTSAGAPLYFRLKVTGANQ